MRISAIIDHLQQAIADEKLELWQTPRRDTWPQLAICHLHHDRKRALAYSIVSVPNGPEMHSV